MGKLISLNLRVCTLYGYENDKSIQCLDSMIKGIKSGDQFPPVHIFYIRGLEFSISGYYFVDTLEGRSIADGGHHRAIAHYLQNKSLLCQVDERVMSIPGLPGQTEHAGNILIPEINLIDSEYIRKKRMFEIYR